ncbi:MAG: sigma-70 family RNA polymerase sigma factor [Gammaproteobacteria bacterium]|nr:sigma-70 family RNA polymerase sigma factor [Gammaproteobacteria bacterium]
MRKVLGAFASLLALGVLVVIGNAIRLEIGARRAEIEVTKLVGGSNAFVRRPFLYEGFFLGLIGGLLATAITAILVAALAEPVSRVSALYGGRFVLSGLDFLEAARALVLSHLRFVVHIARGYSGYGLPMGDLVQEGNVGLMKAVKRFDPSIGVRLVSFAVHWIRAEIHEYVLRNWRLVKVATTKAQRKLFFNLRRLKKNLTWLSPEETRTVARELGVSEHEVTEMERRLAARDLSFDPTPAESEEDDTYSPATYLPAPDADPAAQVENEEWEDDTHERLAAAMQSLDARSRDILASRWMAGDAEKATLHDLAAK